MVKISDVRQEAKRLLEKGKVRGVVGYVPGTRGGWAIPYLIQEAERAEQLVWDPTCVHNLALFVVEEKKEQAKQKEPDKRPLAVMVKGCDSRAINVLLQEKFINREEVVLLGVSCENSGVVDRRKITHLLHGQQAGEIRFGDNGNIVVVVNSERRIFDPQEVLADRCLECQYNFPVVFDYFYGEKIKKTPPAPYAQVEKLESFSLEKRRQFWEEEMARCLRCYACRSVCPMCYCAECVVDPISFAVEPTTTAEEKAKKIKWIEKSPLLSENFVYHLVRAIHLAGRCVDCGECERVCPEGISIRLLNKKLEREALRLFNYVAGTDSQAPSLLSTFQETDPEDFIW
ncbi:MAG TPA: hydrogenase [Candidatus Aminicenantes bacterium]|nr:hydrogenase [Candidatus Aminicenantes bacterium]